MFRRETVDEATKLGHVDGGIDGAEVDLDVVCEGFQFKFTWGGRLSQNHVWSVRQMLIQIKEPVHSLPQPQWFVWADEQFALELIESLLLLKFFIV